MRQHNLLDTARLGGKCIPETTEATLIELLAQLLLSTLSPTVTAEEEDSDEQD